MKHWCSHLWRAWMLNAVHENLASTAGFPRFLPSLYGARARSLIGREMEKVTQLLKLNPPEKWGMRKKNPEEMLSLWNVCSILIIILTPAGKWLLIYLIVYTRYTASSLMFSPEIRHSIGLWGTVQQKYDFSIESSKLASVWVQIDLDGRHMDKIVILKNTSHCWGNKKKKKNSSPWYFWSLLSMTLSQLIK